MSLFLLSGADLKEFSFQHTNSSSGFSLYQIGFQLSFIHATSEIATLLRPGSERETNNLSVIKVTVEFHEIIITLN